MTREKILFAVLIFFASSAYTGPLSCSFSGYFKKASTSFLRSTGELRCSGESEEEAYFLELSLVFMDFVDSVQTRELNSFSIFTKNTFYLRQMEDIWGVYKFEDGFSLDWSEGFRLHLEVVSPGGEAPIQLPPKASYLVIDKRAKDN